MGDKQCAIKALARLKILMPMWNPVSPFTKFRHALFVSVNQKNYGKVFKESWQEC